MPRFRRHFQIQESDCTVVSDVPGAIDAAHGQLTSDLLFLHGFTDTNFEWKVSLQPTVTSEAHPLIRSMETVSSQCFVGPMAGVAGVLADRMHSTVRSLMPYKILVVENGGEILIDSKEDVIVGLYVMTTALKANLGFKFRGGSPPLGIGTSSGTFGHAFSFGQADAVTVFAESAGIADAAATYICNKVSGDDINGSVERALPLIDEIEGVQGVIIARGGMVGKNGLIPELVTIQDGETDILDIKFALV